MNFEWDERKRELNIRKHGLDLADAPGMFALPMLNALDTRYDYGEDRWLGIGFCKDVSSSLSTRNPTLKLSELSHLERP